MPPPLRPAHALLLGALHGPTELLPVSSSAHTTLVPWLLGWTYAELDPEVRKAFEVALHAGTAVALLVGLRDEVAIDRSSAVLAAGSVAPPSVVGYLLERPIQRRLGTPATIAAGLLLGSVVLVAADRLGATGRRRQEAGLADALALGIGQACALVPGTSRSGMTLAAARLRGFDRVEAGALSRRVALPVIVGATALNGARLARRGVPRPMVRAFAAGMGAAFVSTLGAVRVMRTVDAFAPYAAYRALLAGAVLRRAWQTRSR
jgi:undecaprenyl-diphosphatase